MWLGLEPINQSTNQGVPIFSNCGCRLKWTRALLNTTIRTHSSHTLMKPFVFLAVILCCFACTKEPINDSALFDLSDPNLVITLIAEQPTIQTPIGITFDDHDHLYVLESHTHSPASDYKGPLFDRIKIGKDNNKDGCPDQWQVFADSIEDGMNLIAVAGQGILLATKNQIIQFQDTDQDGLSDQKTILLDMHLPQYVYDHAGILGLAAGPDEWLYVSRGNTGGQFWEIKGTDSSSIHGYGDGGNIIRCKMDGSSLEEVATGFWNPFDLKFTKKGRLLATDNDPDSRGPNRLLDIVSGGDYGYQSMYGGSGIHPYLAWNGELPGTLPYAAPLGEAPCALIDAAYTNFGLAYNHHVFSKYLGGK